MSYFLKRIITFLIGLIFLLSLISYILVVDSPAGFQSLYKYQINKIENSTELYNIFIGDSSLGNAINSEIFSKLYSQTTLNSALSGLYGYAGSYNILKTAHQNHPELKNVIIMHTIDMQMREVSYAGYVRTADSFDDFAELIYKDKLNFLKSYIPYIRSIPLFGSSNNEGLINNDYIKQGEAMKLNNGLKPFNVHNINPQKNEYLLKIIDYCSKNNVNLIYVHGPYYESIVNMSQPYISEINRKIKKTGIILIDDVVKIKSNHIGSTEDHIHPDYKDQYTLIYYDLIKNLLED